MPDSYGDTVAFLGQLARRRHRRHRPTRAGASATGADPSPPTSWRDNARTDRLRAGRVASGHASPTTTSAGSPSLRHHRCVASRSCGPSRVRRIDARPPGRRPRPEHQRVGPTHRPRPGGHRADARARRGARRRRRRHAGPSRRWRPHRRRHIAVGQIDHVVSAGREGDVVRAATHDARLPVRQDRRTPAPAHPRRRHRHRRAHRPAPHRVVPVQRRAHQPLPRDRRLELPRQRMRRSRPTAPSASVRGGPATGRCSSRAPRSCTTSPASRSTGSATSRPSSCPTARRGTTPRIRSLPAAAPTGDARRASRARPDGATPSSWCPWDDVSRSTATTACSTELWPAMVRWVEYAAHAARGRSATRARAAAAADAGTPRGVPVGRGLPLGRVARAAAVASVLGGRSGPRGDCVPPPLRVARGPHRPVARARPRRRALRRPRDATRCDAWRTEYVDADGRLTPDTQANHVRALAFGLVRDDARDRTADRLVELIRQAGTHLGTGFLATPYLLPVLADTGHLDVAYELLLQDTPPSWLTMVVARRHHGVGGLGRHRRRRNTEGIAEPLQQGRGHRVPAPSTSPACSSSTTIRATSASASRRGRVAGSRGRKRVHDSPYGRIESSWRIDDDRFRLTVVVPPGTTAEVLLPDGTRQEQTPGRHVIRVLVQCSRTGGMTCALFRRSTSASMKASAGRPQYGLSCSCESCP